jgi:hypothetical protein
VTQKTTQTITTLSGIGFIFRDDYEGDQGVAGVRRRRRSALPRGGPDPSTHPRRVQPSRLDLLSDGDLGGIQVTDFTVTGLLMIADSPQDRPAWSASPSLLRWGLALGAVEAADEPRNRLRERNPNSDYPHDGREFRRTK